MDLVSVVIPAYKTENGQSYPKLEIIIVDDGSSDQTAPLQSIH